MVWDFIFRYALAPNRCRMQQLDYKTPDISFETCHHFLLTDWNFHAHVVSLHSLRLLHSPQSSPDGKGNEDLFQWFHWFNEFHLIFYSISISTTLCQKTRLNQETKRPWQWDQDWNVLPKYPLTDGASVRSQKVRIFFPAFRVWKNWEGFPIWK